MRILSSTAYQPVKEREAEIAPLVDSSVLVRVEDLKKYYPVTKGLLARARRFIHAVDDISFEIKKGEIFGLIGESGCGKTTAGKLLVKLLEPDSGAVYLRNTQIERASTLAVPSASPDGSQAPPAKKTPKESEPEFVDIAHLEGRRLKNFRRHVQMIFQDPYESLNPRMTIFDIVNEPLSVQGIGSLLEREDRVAEMLEHVGLTPATSFMFRFPHELSGGQRQRVAIARAMVLSPSFIVADEPTSMLDVSIRTGVMNLMLQLREEFEISYVYITHDLAVARYMCDRIAVMYLGKIVELGPTEAVIQNPLHPYTRALLSAVPIPDPTVRRQPIELKGSVTKPIDPPPRCRFYDRCPIATAHCEATDHPPLEEKRPGHWAACYEV
jgi:peptide/nickel transport system ATP-binding protein